EAGSEAASLHPVGERNVAIAALGKRRAIRLLKLFARRRRVEARGEAANLHPVGDGDHAVAGRPRGHVGFKASEGDGHLSIQVGGWERYTLAVRNLAGNGSVAKGDGGGGGGRQRGDVELHAEDFTGSRGERSIDGQRQRE